MSDNFSLVFTPSPPLVSPSQPLALGGYVGQARVASIMGVYPGLAVNNCPVIQIGIEDSTCLPRCYITLGQNSYDSNWQHVGGLGLGCLDHGMELEAGVAGTSPDVVSPECNGRPILQTHLSTVWSRRQQAVCVRHAFKHYGSSKNPNHVLENLNMTVAKGTIEAGVAGTSPDVVSPECNGRPILQTHLSTVWSRRQQAVCVRHAFKHYGSSKNPNHVLENLNMTVAKGTIERRAKLREGASQAVWTSGSNEDAEWLNEEEMRRTIEVSQSLSDMGFPHQIET
uniref:Uncharacterized protein n=1 Tax=Timema cristinae TaxID=61476 RepID=A0A7R9CGF7_TIMCR|nr:unnamed protein product [Timema cristinae]